MISSACVKFLGLAIRADVHLPSSPVVAHARTPGRSLKMFQVTQGPLAYCKRRQPPEPEIPVRVLGGSEENALYSCASIAAFKP